MHRCRLVRFTTRFEYESRRMIVWLALLVTGLGKILSATTVDEVITRLVPKKQKIARSGHAVGVRRVCRESVSRSVCDTGCVCRWRLLS